MIEVSVSTPQLSVEITQALGPSFFITTPAPIVVVPLSTHLQGPQGIQGIPGLNGSSLSRYTHTQAGVALTWTVPHNLGFRPNVSILTTGGQEVWGELLHLSANTLTISFDAPLAGTADCI